MKAARPAWILPVAALAAVWLPLLRLWRQAWVAQPEMAFGWGVPVLAAYFAWERIRRLPAARPPGAAGRIAAWILVALGLLLLPVASLVLEANALWPTAQLASAAAAAAITLGGLMLAGGRPWATGLAFPVGFLFTALVWPTPIHVWIITDLAGANARVAAELVSAAGHPAVVSGNLIAVANGFVGVAEACSGLRSLPAVWMAGWFFGELLGLNWPRRIGLVGLALGVALADNLARTVFLTWEAAARGLAESDRWHDPAGAVELVVTLILVGAAALWVGRKKIRGQVEKVAVGACADRNFFNLTPYFCTVLAVALLSVAGVQAWYFAHERGGRLAVHWELRTPGPEWRAVPLPARVPDVLQFSEEKGLAGRDPRTNAAVVAFLVAWRGDAANAENPEWHDPTICLPGAGGQLLASLGEFPVEIDGVEVPFAGSRFLVGGRTLQVFFCHWDAEIGRARGDAADLGYSVRARRWQRVREGRRQNDVAHLTFELQEADDAAAVAWLRAWAPRLLQPHFSAHDRPL